MKFYWKMFISFFILISLTFAVSGTWMISASFKTSLQREIEMGMSRNELYRTALQNAVSAVPADYFTKQNLRYDYSVRAKWKATGRLER